MFPNDIVQKKATRSLVQKQTCVRVFQTHQVECIQTICKVCKKKKKTVRFNNN